MTVQDCTIYNPTKLIIKADGAPDIAQYIKNDGIKKVLIVYGQNSIKKSGLYDKVIAQLDKLGIEHVDLQGVRANPEIHKATEGVKLAKENNVDGLLAIGGGSVIDTCKCIASGWSLDSEPTVENIWKLCEEYYELKKALPIYVVLTISATGSEMNPGYVMQNDELKKKWGGGDILLFPKVSIVDPKVQQTLSWYQTTNGLIDSIMHILEYVTNIDDTESVETVFSYNIALIRSIIKCGNKLQQDPQDYNARANFCWAATCALNGLTGVFYKGGCLAVHYLEHAMGAINPKISHGAGLGVAFPAFVKANAIRGKRLSQYDRIAREVYGKEGWQGLIEGFQQMVKNWGHTTTLTELYGRPVTEKDRNELVKVFMQRPYSGYETLTEDLIRDAYKFME